jgi:hypothetical protein
MALTESHDCNWEASGCAIRSFFVCFSYDFKAALKTAWKRELEEAPAVVDVLDMIGVGTAVEPIKLCEGWSAYRIRREWAT